jgi:hypothetical protein
MHSANAGTKKIRRVALAIGALPIVFAVVVLATGQIEAGGRTMSLGDAWLDGWIQGCAILNLALVVLAVALWKLKSWARWPAFLWFPALAMNNLLTEVWHTRRIGAESADAAVVISGLWLLSLYPILIGPYRGRASDLP